MLEKIVSVDKIEVTELGHIQIRTATKILDDGKEISKTYHRHVLAPGDSLEEQDERVVAIANTVWTAEIVAEYKNKMMEMNPKE